MMVETSRLPGQYYMNSFISPGESEGSGSDRYEAEFVVSEDSSAPMRKCSGTNAKGGAGFQVPSEVFTISGISSSSRKNLIHRLRTELEQIRGFQKKHISDRNNCSYLLNAKPAKIARTSVLVSPALRKNHCLDQVISAKVPPAKQPPGQSASTVMLMKQCDTLLKRLMGHRYGWVFNKPVDVKALNIPDYFDVIKHPMDLGTVKSRLGSGSYSSPLELVSDVRLTFSNAMTYNPPGNHVHIMADTLSKFFELRWKSIEKRLMVIETQGSLLKSGLVDEMEVSKSIIAPKKRKIPPVQHEVSTPKPPKRMMTTEEKQKLGQQLESLLEDIPENIINFLKNNCSNGKDVGEEEIEIDIDGLSDDVLFSLKRLLDEHCREKRKDESCAEACEIEILNESGLSNSSMQLCKANEQAEEDVDIGGNEPPVSSCNLTRKDRDPETIKCVNSGSSSDSGHDGNSRKDRDANSSSPVNKPKAREVVEGLEAKSGKTSSLFSADESIGKMDLIEQASLGKDSPSEAECGQDGETGPNHPERSYRTAVLINRFADTILKAQEKTLSQGDKDPEKLQREREELLNQRQKEKARLQAEARAAEDARRRAEAEALAEARRKRELEREAARQALLKMEKTVHIDESSSFLEDLEMLKAAAPVENLPSSADETSPDHTLDGFGSFKLGGTNPLEQLGLFMKEDEEEEEAADQPSGGPSNYEDGVEEGEID
ncbi:hypothetical protein MLD38_013249 [Melastoma candidum]|uniref:Uncharacterized protein n=1 Tax=Melastoma candidum TaxID=119954 RepID=A0ACB9R918_9MYRT|nr:hypothetical protein MLD38_013249 [Melastoma candidum]